MEHVRSSSEDADSLVGLMMRLEMESDTQSLPSDLMMRNVDIDDCGPLLAAIMTVEDPTHQVIHTNFYHANFL